MRPPAATPRFADLRKRHQARGCCRPESNSATLPIAQAEMVRGNVERAQVLLAQAQDYWVSTGSVVHKALLNESRKTQSRLERAQGRVEDSLATLQAAIDERQLMLGEEDVETGGHYVSLAIGLMQAGRLDEAEAAASEGLRIHEQLGLAESDGGLAALNARANIALGAGRAEQSIADFRRVSNMTRALYGETPKLATAMNNLGISLMRTGQVAEAAPVIEEALRIARASDGERSRLAVALRAATAEAWAVTGRLDEAEPLVEEALDVAQADFIADPVLLGTAYRVRAKLRLEQLRHDEARADLEQAARYFGAAGKAGEPYLRRLEALQGELEGAPPG
ncbi:MAG TPA: tetratricopeptide repeat protein [Chiayiivirga sp.]|nr:tetratricopeptide repeat protein [Chiayiivirga sp.]